jgi:UDP-2,3-diacylglucosamine hydrolase
MNNRQKTLFISDLHLDESCPCTTQLFIRFLRECHSTSIDALYILGDLFNTWIGDDNDTLWHREVIKALKTVTQKGIPIHLLRGNRDFLLGKSFLRKTGCKISADEEKIILYGQPVLLMHGDTLCTRDTGYLKARKIVHNIIAQKIFLTLPLRIRQYIANKLRIKSAQHTQATALSIMDVTQEEVEHVMRKHAVSYLIHGHTHRPNMHKFLIEDKPVMRIVLGAWHKYGNVLIWTASGDKKLIDFSDVTNLMACN